MISIYMLKLCDKSICKTLNIILFFTIFPFLNGKKPMQFQYIKRMTNSVLKTTTLPPSSLYAAKFLKALFTTLFLYFLQNKLISKNSLLLSLVTTISANSQPLCIKCNLVLTTTMKLGQPSVIYLKLLTEFVMKELLIN